MKKHIKFIYANIKERLASFKYFFKVKKIVNMETYYPEIKRKSKFIRYIDNFKHILKYKEINNFYNLYGMDTIEKRENYIDYNTFMKKRNEYNMQINTYKTNYNYIALLRDKNIFEKYMNSISVNTAKTVAMIKNGKIYSRDLQNVIDEEELFESGKEYFIKYIGGECADGVYYINSYESYKSIKEEFKEGIYIIQDKLIQNDEMIKLGPNSINTIRIVTVNNGIEIKVLAAVCRMGVNSNVDNWATGGIAVNINIETGKLDQYGYYKPGKGTKTAVHPITKVKFEDFKIPYWEEVKETVTRAHNSLYGIHSIGWDVAITNEGPALIEGNDNWEISLNQISKGLKKEWIECLYKKR